MKKFTKKQIASAAAVIVNPPSQAFTDGQTLAEYLKSLLSTLWKEAEEFSGKRPFGEGAWQMDVYRALIKAGLTEGKLTEDGYVRSVDVRQADDLVFAVIKRLDVS